MDALRNRRVAFAYAGKDISLTPIMPGGILPEWRTVYSHNRGNHVHECAMLLPESFTDLGAKLVPCVSAIGIPYAYQFVLKYIGDECIEARAFAPVGPFPEELRAKTTSGQSGVMVNTDVAEVINIVGGNVWLELSVYDPEGVWPAMPHLVTVSSGVELSCKPITLPSVDSSVSLSMPSLSQLEILAPECDRMCSPTSVAMVAGFYGREVNPLELAERICWPEIGPAYGVWPANVWGAGQYGLLGYVVQFPNWPAAQSLLDKGRPIVASIRYEQGELAGAPLGATPFGHVVVLAGYKGDQVMVYDPGAPNKESVRRSYDLVQFCRSWFNHQAVGYVLFPAA